MTQKEFCLSGGLALSTLQRYLHNGQRKQTTAAKSRLVAVEVTSNGRLSEPETGCGLALVGAEGRLSAYRMWYDFHLTDVVSLAKSENAKT